MNTEKITHEQRVAKNKEWMKKHPILTGIIVLLLIGFVGSLFNDDSKPSQSVATETKTEVAPEQSKAPAEEVVKVTASKMIADYKANEISADATYKGKLVAVSGSVGSIAKDIMDNPYITITNDEAYSFESVQCVFSKSQEAELAGVSKKQAITLQGRVSGKLGNVIVRECSIVK